MNASSNKQITSLHAFWNTLRQEAHILTREPGLLWQQLHNRLQWLDSPSGNATQEVLETERERRQQSGNAWFRMLEGSRDPEALQRTLAGHKQWVTGCVFTPDGNFLISCSWDCSLRVWNRATGREVAILKGHSFYISSCCLSYDGRLLASSSHDGMLIVWDWRSGQALRKIKVLNGIVHACAFSPDGGRLASLDDDRTVRLWDPGTGQEIARRREDVGRGCLAISPCGEVLFSSSGDEIHLWSSTLDRKMASLSGSKAEGSVSCAGFSPDGRQLATGTSRGWLTLWDLAEKKPLTSFPAHRETVNACTFSPDGKDLATCSGDDMGLYRELRVWEAGSWKMAAQFSGHAGSVNACTFSPDGDLLASASSDNTVKFWLTKKGSVAEDGTHSLFIHHAVFSLDGRKLACAHKEGLMLLDGSTGRQLLNFAGHEGSVLECAFSPDGDQLLSAGADGTARLWDVCSGEQVQEVIGVADEEFEHIHSCGFSPDGKLMITVLRWGTAIFLHIWERASGEEIAQVNLEDNPESFTHDFPCRFSPDGSMLVTRSCDDLVFREPSSGDPLLEVPGAAGCYAFSADGSLVALGGSGKRLAVITRGDILRGTGSGVEHLGEHEAKITACAFSPDGKMVVCGDALGTLKAWSLAQYDLIWSVQAHARGIFETLFPPGGEFLITASDDQTIRTWRTRDGAALGSFFCRGEPQEIRLEPSGRRLVCNDHGGYYYLLHLEGFADQTVAGRGEVHPLRSGI